MTTEQYQVGYEEGYADGFEAGCAPVPHTITVPRETWDAMREALEKSRSARTYSERIEAHECAVLALTAANAVNAFGTLINEGTIASVQPQAQGESYSERWYGSGEDRGWWIVRGGLVKREHVAFLGEFVSPEEVSKVVAELNAAHPQATEPAWMPIETAPKDGSEILLGHPDGSLTVGWWRARNPSQGWTDGDSYAMGWPTHWQPAPAAPEAKQ